MQRKWDDVRVAAEQYYQLQYERNQMLASTSTEESCRIKKLIEENIMLYSDLRALIKRLEGK